MRNNLKHPARMILTAIGLAVSVHAAAQQPQPRPAQAQTITFYQNEGFSGRWFSTDRRIGNFERYGFNDAANSVKVRGGRWEVCTAPRFEGRCVILRRGDYPSLREAGLEDRISSARPIQRNSRDWDRRGAYDRQAVPDRR
jgi:Beta/Gamma crystallin